MPNADRSMPSSLRPASREAATSLSIISRRTATTTTRVRGWPDGVSTVPSDCQSRIASSIGIGMWSGACTLTAAASAFSSSSGGRSSVRTTIRWFAIPSRTRFESPFSAKKVFSASASAGTSATSPSRRTPGRRGATAPRLSDSDPLTVTSAAAMWPGSRSRPTIAAWEEERFLNTFEVSARARRGLTTKRARRPASRSSFGTAVTYQARSGRAAALGVGVRAGAGDRAVGGLRDRELVAGAPSRR